MVEHDVIAIDGRTLRVLEDGDPSGSPDDDGHLTLTAHHLETTHESLLAHL